MKIGKHIKLNDHENVKLSYGTVDNKTLKSIYLEMDSWVEPIGTKLNYNNIIYVSRKKIKNRIRQIQTDFFKKDCIVDIDIKTNSIKEGKRSFMNIQITLFCEKKFEIKSKEIKEYINSLMIDVINNDLIDKNLYIFHKTKK